MTNTIKNTATPMKERLKGFEQIAIASVLLIFLGGSVSGLMLEKNLRIHLRSIKPKTSETVLK